MKYSSMLLFLMGMLFFFACQKENVFKQPDTPVISVGHACSIDSEGGNWIFFQDGESWLYGGKNDDWHFNISNWDLEACGLRFGLGRESFQALLEPQYSPLNEAQQLYSATDKFIVVALDNGYYKAYSLGLMTKHEVINEVINDQPVMVVYCALADLAAVYSRNYCDKTLTFALSGYTYHDPNIQNDLDAFVLWDRETESLWWPLINRAVSGKMNGNSLKEYSEGWQVLTLSELIQNYDNEKILVLKNGQTMDIPRDWPQFEELDCE